MIDAWLRTLPLSRNTQTGRLTRDAQRDGVGRRGVSLDVEGGWPEALWIQRRYRSTSVGTVADGFIPDPSRHGHGRVDQSSCMMTRNRGGPVRSLPTKSSTRAAMTT